MRLDCMKCAVARERATARVCMECCPNEYKYKDDTEKMDQFTFCTSCCLDRHAGHETASYAEVRYAWKCGFCSQRAPAVSMRVCLKCACECATLLEAHDKLLKFAACENCCVEGTHRGHVTASYSRTKVRKNGSITVCHNIPHVKSDLSRFKGVLEKMKTLSECEKKVNDDRLSKLVSTIENASVQHLGTMQNFLKDCEVVGRKLEIIAQNVREMEFLRSEIETGIANATGAPRPEPPKSFSMIIGNLELRIK